MKPVTIVAIPASDGFVCYRRTCFDPATYKIGNSYSCYAHAFAARQLKLPLEETHGIERQGKEGTEGVPGGRADLTSGTGEASISEHGSRFDDTGKLLGTQFDSETAQAQGDSSGREGPVLEAFYDLDPFGPEEDTEAEGETGEFPDETPDDFSEGERGNTKPGH